MPWPHAFSFLGGSRYIVLRTSPGGDDRAAAPPGTVLEATGDRLAVATGQGLLRIIEIQPEGRRAMTAREFLAGHGVRAGARFDTRAAQP